MTPPFWKSNSPLAALSLWNLTITLFWVEVVEKKTDIEELCLCEKFPEYIEYMKDKPKFIPGRLINAYGGSLPSPNSREGFVVLEDGRVAE